MEDKYAELEKRVKILEELLKGFLLDEIEDRIDELDSEVDQLENRIDDAENRAEQLKLSLD